MNIFLPALMGGLATLGFCLLLNLRAKLLPFAFLGGMAAIFVYNGALWLLHGSLFFAALLAAAFSTLCSEVCAVLLRAPVTVFLLPCTVPLVPGSGLYETMRALLLHDHAAFLASGAATLSIACGIAAGIMIPSVAVRAGKEIAAALRRRARC